jgi:hypothetical protein
MPLVVDLSVRSGGRVFGIRGQWLERNLRQHGKVAMATVLSTHKIPLNTRWIWTRTRTRRVESVRPCGR